MMRGLGKRDGEPTQATVLVSLPQGSDLAERGSATELLLRGSDAEVVAPQDVDGLVSVLAKRYQQYVTGQCPVRLVARDDRFSRQRQAQTLFDAIGQYTGRSLHPLETL